MKNSLQNNKSNGKISVIIVTLNVQDILQNCLDSIYKQKYSPIEIVIADGGSTDGTLDILKKNDGKLAFWKSERDGGIYEAMNKAIGYATGDWIYFLGADDTLTDDFSKMAFRLSSSSLVYYGNVLTNGTKFRGKINGYQHSKGAICHQAIIYPKLVFKKYMFNTKYRISADHELNMRVWKDKDFSFFYVDLVIANYNHAGVSSRQMDEDFKKDRLKLIFQNHGYLNWLRYSFRLFKRKLFTKRSDITINKTKSIAYNSKRLLSGYQN